VYFWFRIEKPYSFKLSEYQFEWAIMQPTCPPQKASSVLKQELSNLVTIYRDFCQAAQAP